MDGDEDHAAADAPGPRQAPADLQPPARNSGTWQLVRQALRGDAQDYTALPLQRAVFLLAVPMVMEMAMESLFAIADIFWVSRLGADAVATVGLTESLIATVYAIAMGLSVASLQAPTVLIRGAAGAACLASVNSVAMRQAANTLKAMAHVIASGISTGWPRSACTKVVRVMPR